MYQYVYSASNIHIYSYDGLKQIVTVVTCIRWTI